MKTRKVLLLVASVFVLLIGLIWMGQGAGYIQYPPESFMINQSQWIWRGALVAAAGLIGVLLTWRK